MLLAATAYAPKKIPASAAVVEHLGRVVKLKIESCQQLDTFAHTILSHPAPVLRDLKLSLPADQVLPFHVQLKIPPHLFAQLGITPLQNLTNMSLSLSADPVYLLHGTIPPRLFADTAPQLRFVELHDTVLPPNVAISAFAQVKILEIHPYARCQGVRPWFANIARNFPSITQLTLANVYGWSEGIEAVVRDLSLPPHCRVVLQTLRTPNAQCTASIDAPLRGIMDVLLKAVRRPVRVNYGLSNGFMLGRFVLHAYNALKIAITMQCRDSLSVVVSPLSLHWGTGRHDMYHLWLAGT